MSSSAVSDADGFLDELGALNLTSPTSSTTTATGNGRGHAININSMGIGVGARSAGPDQDLEVFNFSTHHHHHHHLSQQPRHSQHPADMDLANFNSVFSSSDGNNGSNKLDGGRRGVDDGMNINIDTGDGGGSSNQNHSQTQTQNRNTTSSPSNITLNSVNSINFDALQQLLSLQMQMQSPMSPTSSGINASSMNSNPFAGLSMPMPISMGVSIPGAVDGATSSSSPSGGGGNQQQQAAVLLEQQLRLQQLQQLQQLQNQIFQQQIELISGQTSLSGSLDGTPLPTPAFRDSNQFQGLPTPANSTELRPQPPPNFVSPMILQNYLSQPGAGTAASGSSVPPNAAASQYNAHSLPQAPSSAPAHLAFSTHAPLLSPGDLEFDLSPITSPWLGAASYQQAQQQLQQHQRHLQHQHQHQQQQFQQQQQPSQTQVQTHTHTRTHAQPQSQSQPQAQTEIGTKRRASKRGASSSGDDADGLGHGRAYATSTTQARKRQSPAIRASIGGASTSLAPTASSTSGTTAVGTTSTRKTAGARRSGSVSLGSTPALRAQQQHHQSQSHHHQNLPQQQQRQETPRSASAIREIVGDTPSPVDLSMSLSMPPPAPPITENESVSGSSGSSVGSQPNPALSPVTPASIMNLGRLGLSSGLSSPLAQAEDQQHQQQPNAAEKTKGKGKSKTPPKTSINASTAPSTSSTSTSLSTQTQTRALSKKTSPSTSTSTATPLISPSLKPLLPGGLAPSSAAQLGSASNYTHHLSGSAASLNITPNTSLPPPAPTIRKTSHKAAEQKRRDSLKTSFDQLRLLLPPLPSPNEEGYHHAYGTEAPLPGSMPPRGPPRGDVQGPNRAVSKLTLLRCGNEYIRLLKGRVERRDEYIESLRREVRALRARVEREKSGNGGGGDVDMNTDEAGERGDSEVEGGGGGGGGGSVEEMVDEFEKVDLEKDLDADEAEEGTAPLLGFGAIPEEGRDEDDED